MSILRGLFLSGACMMSVALGQWGLEGFGMAEEQQQKLVTTSTNASVEAYKEGQPFFIALKGDITHPWHAYYRNPATVGMPIEASVQAPAGFKVEGPFWKLPTREQSMIGVSFSYSAPVLVWRVTPEANAPAEANFTVSSSIQVCSEQGCKEPQNDTNVISLKKGEPTATATWGADSLKDIETLGDTPSTITATQTADTVQLTFTSDKPVTEAYFFSADNSISPTAEQKLEQVEGGYRLTLPRNDGKDMMYPPADANIVGKPLALLQGTLRFGEAHCTVNHNFNAPVPTAPATGAAGQAAKELDVNSAPPSLQLAALFGSLFLGGLILNLMPCVFPVIGLKIMSFVELGGGSRRKVFMHSLTFVLGVLVSFWILSLLLIIFSNLDALASTPWQQWADVLLNDAGAGSRSWAEWMQNNWVVYCIVLLLLVMGLSMYGVFEIGVGATGMGQDLQSKKGYTGSFFSGFFVTVVATPCSGPFLGAAMPAAMALQGPMMVLALTFMALGLASPYIVLGAFPGLVKLLPRPGAWMESLKQGLSFLLFAAAAWALSIYLAFVPQPRVMWVFIALVGVCMAFWVYGRWCPIYRSMGSRIAGFIIALGLLGVSVWYSMPHAEDDAALAAAAPAAGNSYVVATATQPTWNVWSPELMEKALKDGHPVYVDFTAQWCMTCQANKKVAYTEDVLARMAQAGVVLMKADKTRPSPVIDAELRRLKRSAVPVNVLYQVGKEPAITRELLTPGYMLEFLNEKLEGATAPTPAPAADASPAPAATPAAEEVPADEEEESTEDEEEATEEETEEDVTEEDATEEDVTVDTADEEEADSEEEADEEETSEEDVTEEDVTEEEAESTEEEPTETATPKPVRNEALSDVISALSEQNAPATKPAVEPDPAPKTNTHTRPA